MSDDLKRVGLVFTKDGDVDFRKSLQSINAELRENYNQFKLTQTQWDNSTTKQEKLRKELEYSTNAYNIQQQKVETLRIQLEELESAENKDTLAIQKKRAELTKAETSLQNYKNKMKEISNQLQISGEDIIKFGTKIENIGNKVEGAGKKISAFSSATALAFVASAKTAIDFEDAFAGVEKTVDASDEQLEEIRASIRSLAKEIPATTTEIAAVAESAGQLGIKTEDIMNFTKVMVNLGVATNLSSEEAASSLAKFANVTKMSAQDYERLGSTIVALGNNSATTEADIVSMATRLAATGELAGLSQAEILALATSMSSVGIEAEAGGSAMSKLLKQIQVAVETGGGDLKDFAKVAGMTTKQFKKAFEDNAVSALSAFISGLNDTERNGKSAISILNDMDLKEVRLSNTILSLANSSDIMNKSVELANEAWEDNSALTKEANKRYETLKSKLTIALNQIKDMAITLGNKLMPSIQKILDKFGEWINKFSELSDEQVDMIVKIGLFVAAAGPIVTILGKIVTGMGGAVKAFGTLKTAMEVMQGLTTSTSSSVNNLSNILTSLSNPATLVTLAVGALSAAIAVCVYNTEKEKFSLEGLRDEVKNQKESWEQLAETRQNSLSASMTEIEVSEKLADELKTITDENGKVKEGYETRARIILDTLNKALGTEYELNGNIISQYKELKDNIEQVIVTKKAEAVLNAYEEEYGTAIKEQAKATETLIDLKKQLAEASKKMYSADKEEKMQAQLLYGSISKQIGEQTELIGSYGKTISNYETLQKESIEGTANTIKKAVEDMSISYDAAKQKATDSIETQVVAQSEYVKILKESLVEAKANKDEYQSQILTSQLETNQQELDNLVQSMKNQTSTIQELSPEQIEAWKAVASQGLTSYSTALSGLPLETQKKIEEATGVLTSDTRLKNAAGEEAISATTNYSGNLKIAEITQEKVTNAAEIVKNDTSVQSAAEDLADKAEEAVESNDSNTWGRHMVEGLGRGILTASNGSWFKGTISGVASIIASYLHFTRPDKGPLREYEKWMPDMIEGLSDSLDKSSPELVNKVKKMSGEMSDELKNVGEKSQFKMNTNNNNSAIKIEIDYNKMGNVITKSLTNCKFALDEDGFIKIIKNEIYKVV